MNLQRLLAACSLGLALLAGTAHAGAIDPDCTPEKAAKSAAAKSTVGVGGRCDVKEATKDTGKKAAGVEEKGMLDKKSKNDSPVEKAKETVTK